MPMMGSMSNYGSPENRREVYRAPVSDVMARVSGFEGEYAAKDMSPAGIGLGYSANLKVGEPVALSLYDNGELIASDVNARVAHSGLGYTGFYFDNIDESQYDAIDGYVENIRTDDSQYYKYFSPYHI